MIVVCCYVAGMLHPWTVPALVREGYEPELYEVEPPPGPNSYPSVLRYWLLSGVDFCVVEQDVETVPGALAALEACPRPWCWHSYPGPGGEESALAIPRRYPWLSMLGHTRFRAGVGALGAAMLGTRRWMTDWDCRDLLLSRYLRRAGLTPHLHLPSVRHHHGYEHEASATSETCSCDQCRRMRAENRA